MAVMGRVVFMCGPAGSGKSTVARRLETEGMARLSFDEMAWSRGHRVMPLPSSEQEDIALQLRVRLLELIDAGGDVLPEIYCVDAPREVVLSRLRGRTAAHGDDFSLDEATAIEYFDQFQAPTDEEGPITVIGT